MHLQRLRLVLFANGMFSAAAGLVALLAGSWVSQALGIDHVTLTRLLGAGLLVFGADVIYASRAGEERLLPAALLISAADIVWVIATAVVVVSGVLSTTGNVVAVVQGLAVADFAAAQLWFRSRALQSDLTGAAATVAV